MNNFIIEFKNALAPEFCQKLIKKFESSQDKVAGRTGDGVDKSKKDSVDLYLSNSPQWQEEAKNISEMVLKATVEYVKQYPLMLTGAISPSMKDPVTGEQKTIHHEDIGRMNNQQIEHLVKHI
ncbi:MAG: 2OG-Fe(II) oxygenase, partial [Colwellia sp.]